MTPEATVMRTSVSDPALLSRPVGQGQIGAAD
jgi:hypothetical protein